MRKSPLSRQLIGKVSRFGFVVAVGCTTLLGACQYRPSFNWQLLGEEEQFNEPNEAKPAPEALPQPSSVPFFLRNGRPLVYPLPVAQEVWQCEVIVVGGSLGGVAAASHAMKSGARTCLIEVTPWLGGQISSQGVSALDESITMMEARNFSPSWNAFKQLIKQQPVKLPTWIKQTKPLSVTDINSCWVSQLCFPPKAGADAALQLLKSAAKSAPGSRWSSAIAFKGAEFDQTGANITAVYAVRRIPRNPNYMPQGRPSQELSAWYSWSEDENFRKVPIRLEAPPKKRLIVIDATDTGELVGWARIPHRLGSESRFVTGEPNAPLKGNPECTQAFTFPFLLALRNDQGRSRAILAQIQPEYSRAEHQRDFSLLGFPMLEGRSVFKYRRIVSTTRNAKRTGTPAPADITMINWMQGNDWNRMNPPLILTQEKLTESGQYQNWMGGVSTSALRHAEERAFLFAEWLMKTYSSPQFPLTYLSGQDSLLGTVSGLSIMPYIREGRRILGRAAYGQKAFSMREVDIRKSLQGKRNFNPTAVAVTHYGIDIHGCVYRNWKPSWEATSAGIQETFVRPATIPLESLIPQGVENLLIGSKGIAVTHIVNASTRIHYGEWSIGGAAGTTAGWLIQQNKPDLTPALIVPRKLMPQLQQYLKKQGLRFDWQ